MSFSWYEASTVSAFSVLKNSDINVNLLAIEQAFIDQNAQIIANGSIAVAASGSRRYGIDLSNAQAGTNLVVTMPASSAVGDPPITIELLGTNVQVGGSAASVVTIGLNGDALYGGAAEGCPFLATVGDSVSLVKVNNVFWIYNDFNLLPFVLSGGALYPTLSAVHPLYHLESAFLDTSGGALALNIAPINFAGGQAFITKTSGASALTVGTAGEFYNGVAGPLVLAAGVRYSLTCIAANAFFYTLA